MDPIAKLFQLYNSEQHDSTYHRIVEFIITNLDKIEQYSISELSDATFVSPSTISRFIQHLGVENFSLFKQYLSGIRHSSKQSFFKLTRENQHLLMQDPHTFLLDYSQQIARAIQDFAQTIDIASLDQLIHRMMETKQVAILGYADANIIAKDIQLGFLSVRKPIEVAETEKKMEDIIQRFTNQSLIVILSNYGNFFSHFNSYYKQILLKEIPIILVTQNYQSMDTFRFENTIYLTSQRQLDSGNYPLRIFSEYLVRRAVFIPR